MEGGFGCFVAKRCWEISVALKRGRGKCVTASWDSVSAVWGCSALSHGFWLIFLPFPPLLVKIYCVISYFSVKMEINTFEITKTVNQMNEFLDKILTACLKSCQIPCNVLYGLEVVFLNGANKPIKSKL